jgi:hypothetical protein
MRSNQLLSRLDNGTSGIEKTQIIELQKLTLSLSAVASDIWIENMEPTLILEIMCSVS